ncbi:Epoxide hydrolase srdG [Paramyrothecium foliicola]|nr:Epoxide hydrolase srdG [Paramyrothecium foliicola]
MKHSHWALAKASPTIMARSIPVDALSRALTATCLALLACSTPHVASAAYVQEVPCEGVETPYSIGGLLATMSQSSSEAWVNLRLLDPRSLANDSSLPQDEDYHATITMTSLRGNVSREILHQKGEDSEGEAVNLSTKSYPQLSLSYTMNTPRAVDDYFLEIRLHDQANEILLACSNTVMTPAIGRPLSAVAFFLPVVTLGFVLGTSVVAYFVKPLNFATPAISMLVLPFSSVGHFADCLTYIQVIFFSGTLSLHYPGFVRPIISLSSWSTLMFPDGPIYGDSLYRGVSDGIYEVNGTFGGTFGLELISQITGAPATDWTWVNVISLTCMVLASLMLIFQLGPSIPWTQSIFDSKAMRRIRGTEAHGLKSTLYTVLRLFFSYFMTPVAAWTFYQLNFSRMLPVYHIVISSIVLTLIPIAFWWSLRQAPARQLAYFLVNDTGAYRGGEGNVRPQDQNMLAIFMFGFMYLRGCAIGGLQVSGLLQLLILCACEILQLGVTMLLYRAAPLKAAPSLLCIVRLISWLLCIGFLPGVASHISRCIVGIVLLSFHLAVLVLVFLLPATLKLASVGIRAVFGGSTSGPVSETPSVAPSLRTLSHVTSNGITTLSTINHWLGQVNVSHRATIRSIDSDALSNYDLRVKHEFLLVKDDIEYHYLLASPESQPLATVLLLHGWPDLGLGWRFQVPHLLSQNIQVIVPDMLGYGETSAPQDAKHYSLKSVAADLVCIIRNVTSEPVFVGGHDWGSIVAWRLALYYPDAVRGVFGFSVPFFPPLPVVASLKQLVEQNPNLSYQLQAASGEAEAAICKSTAHLRGFFNGIFGGVTSDGDVMFVPTTGIIEERLQKIEPSPLVPPSVIDYYVSQYTKKSLHGPFNWYRTTRINSEEELLLAEKGSELHFQMPGMLVMAGQDPALPPSMADGQERFFPKGLMKKVISNASHWILIQSPEEANQCIGDFSLLTVCAMASVAFGHDLCGSTLPPDEARDAARSLQLSRHEARSLDNFGLRNGNLLISTYVHVIESEQDIGFVTDKMLNDQLKVLNDTFSPHRIQFIVQEVTYTINDEWASSTRNRNKQVALRRGGYDELNLYFETGVGRKADSISGLCEFPVEDPLNSGMNGTSWSIWDGCHVGAVTMPGGPGLPGDPTISQGKTATHEVGHWFGLFHVFDGDDCDGEGDLVDDTPATLGSFRGCNIGQDTCPDHEGLDPIHNYMDYSSDPCQNEFTQGQEERMYQSFNTLRRASETLLLLQETTTMSFNVSERVAFRSLCNKGLLFTVPVLAVSQFNFGFDNSAFRDIQAMDICRTMGPGGKKVLTPSWLSLFNGLSVVGFFIGVLIGNRLSEKIGRRNTVRTMCCCTLVCATILVMSRHRYQMVAGRTLNHIYTGMELAVIPLYQAEITPLPARGVVVATYNTALILGSLIMGLICYGTSRMDGRIAYLLPLCLFYIIPTVVLASTFWMPESPRWLSLRDRHDEALKSLGKLREGAFDELQIQEEMTAIAAGSANQVYRPAEANVFTCWSRIGSREDYQRTMIVLGTNFFLHGTGNAFANRYGTLFYKSISTVDPFALSCIQSTVVLVVSITTLFLVDWIGRRPLLIGGSFVQLSGLLILGGLGLVPRTYSSSAGIITTVMVFVSGYTAAWGQLSHTITAELPSAEVRDLAYATGSLLAVATQAAVTFSLPYLLNPPYAAPGPKVGFIFGSITVLGFIFAIFCVPECTGKSLEEIDVLFNNNVPVRQFKGARVVFEEVDKGGATAARIMLKDGKETFSASQGVARSSTTL